MQSVFNGAQVHKGSFKADNLTLQLGDSKTAGFMVQNANFQFAQQVSMLYEVGSANVYYVGGRAQGAGTFGAILGPSALSDKLITTFSDLCKPADMVLKMASKDCNSAENGVDHTYEIIDAVLTTIAFSTSAQEVVINQQLQFIFIDLQR